MFVMHLSSFFDWQQDDPAPFLRQGLHNVCSVACVDDDGDVLLVLKVGRLSDGVSSDSTVWRSIKDADHDGGPAVFDLGLGFSLSCVCRYSQHDGIEMCSFLRHLIDDAYKTSNPAALVCSPLSLSSHSCSPKSRRFSRPSSNVSHQGSNNRIVVRVLMYSASKLSHDPRHESCLWFADFDCVSLTLKACTADIKTASWFCLHSCALMSQLPSAPPAVPSRDSTAKPFVILPLYSHHFAQTRIFVQRSQERP